MCFPGPAVPTPAEPLSFFYSSTLQFFLTSPFRAFMGRTDPCRAAQFFIAVPGQFVFRIPYCTSDTLAPTSA